MMHESQLKLKKANKHLLGSCNTMAASRKGNR